MEPAERRVLEAIREQELLAFLDRLIAVPSVAGEETAAQELVADQMRRSGLRVDEWRLDFEALGRHPAYCEEIPRQEGLGVVGALGEGVDGRRLILNGHVDVVPPGDLADWSHPPWQATIVGDRLFGRGAADMKGGLCCALFAAKALVDADVRLAGELVIESVIGEEDGGVGTLAALQRGYRADAAIIAEPTRLDVVTTQAGALSFRLTVFGAAAHGSVRLEGVSAVEKFLPLLSALEGLEERRNRAVAHGLMRRHSLPYALSIGTLRAGEWSSSVPDRLVCEGRYGVAVGEQPAAARREFEAAVEEACLADAWLSEHPPKVEWWGGRFEAAEISCEHPVVVTVRQAVHELAGEPAPVAGVPYGADMRLLINEGGIPTILFGPGDVRAAHRPDESVALGELRLAARVLALVAMRYCGTMAGRKVGTAG